MLATRAMQMSPNSSCLSQSQSESKLAANRFSSLEKIDLCVFYPAHKVPNKLRFLPARAVEGYDRSRASSSMPETERGHKNTHRDPKDSENVSVWDSNAEGIRGSWKRANTTPSFGSRPVEERPDTYASDQEDNWQWWRSGPDDDDYEGDADDDEEDSWFNFDMLSAISMLRWMVPAAAVILPWLFGGPMFLMMAFAFFPLLEKLLGVFMPRSWKVALQGRNTSSSKQRGRQGKGSGFWNQPKYNPFMESRKESDFFDSNVEDWETSFLRSSMNREATSKLGGWDQEKDDVVAQKKVKRGKKKAALERRRSRGEVPLFFRLLVALFPFLRSWGGFL